MAKPVTPLTDTKIDAAKYNPDGKGNKLFDGGGLFLLIKPSGSKSWRMKYKRPSGKEDTLVFGDYPTVPLKLARQKRDEAQARLAQGIDPKAHERGQAQAKAKADENTFQAVAMGWHAAHYEDKNPDHAEKVLTRLEKNVFPEIGKRPIQSIGLHDLMTPIEKIQKRKAHDLAGRVKQYLASIMSYAMQRRYIERNPAHDLPRTIKKPKTKHHPALPLNQLPEFLARISAYRGQTLTRLAMRLTLLVFIRSSELRFARWDEIDFARALWTIPGNRVPIDGVKHSRRGAKMGATHLVPLSRQALDVLVQLREISGHRALIFPGARNRSAPLSESTINQALRRMGYNTKKEVKDGNTRQAAVYFFTAELEAWVAAQIAKRDQATA